MMLLDTEVFVNIGCVINGWNFYSVSAIHPQGANIQGVKAYELRLELPQCICYTSVGANIQVTSIRAEIRTSALPQLCIHGGEYSGGESIRVEIRTS